MKEEGSFNVARERRTDFFEWTGDSETWDCENGRLIVEKSCEFKGKSVSRRNSELGEDLSQIRANTCGRATSRVGSPFQKRKMKNVERKLSEKITQTSLFRAYLFIAVIGWEGFKKYCPFLSLWICKNYFCSLKRGLKWTNEKIIKELVNFSHYFWQGHS